MVDGSMDAIWWYQVKDFELIEKEVEMKGKKMWRVIHPATKETCAGQGFADAEGPTADDAIDCVASMTNHDGGHYGHWADLYRMGYRVESFTTTPEIDWEPIIMECLGLDSWGDSGKCPFCVAVGGPNHCGDCLFAEYTKANPGKVIDDRFNSGCLKTVHGGYFTAANFIPVLSDMLVWYRARKDKGNE